MENLDQASFVVSSSSSKRPKSKVIFLVSVLVIVILASWLFILIRHHQEKTAYQTLVKNMNMEARHDKNAGIISLGIKFSSNYKGRIDKSQLYFLDTNLAAAYQNTGDLKDALIWQLGVVSNDSAPSSNDYLNLANIYYGLGDKNNALKYYKLAQSKMAKLSPLQVLESDNSGSVIASRIQQLEQKN